MYKHGKVGFRPIEKCDLEILRNIRNHRTTFIQMGTVEMVSSLNQEEWWNNDPSSGNSPRFSIVNEDDKVIGILRLQNIDYSNSNCEIGIDIGVEYRKRGYGKEAYECVLHYLFNQKNMNMVYLKVAKFNEIAIKLYTNLGFLEFGYFPQYLYRDGKYWDYNIMAITKETYLNQDL